MSIEEPNNDVRKAVEPDVASDAESFVRRVCVDANSSVVEHTADSPALDPML